ncbi:pro-sigmaK processing inhibitor BofA family protein [Fonticella tunisiensis]|uniref:Inhibitor of the pro-sigma K processing machinery n=1 Tax=Fonticella tunisiensis TaxID=1096341 RepID=A0A4R7K8I2_9CLOT|nr:pro-sigmaK processing inhibitor BofA family protein [Fonticella tunisiensis]TDT50259.1 inhibitor of the pro-sigma K processing machinery [Fonticella tunisiensis]
MSEILSNTQVYIFLFIIIVLSIISIALKKGSLIIKIPIKFLIGGLFIYIINFFAEKVSNFTIPLNPITAFAVGVLELPGLILILMIKYLIYPL